MDPPLDGWPQAFPGLTANGAGRKLRKLLEAAEAAHRKSAAGLRSCGNERMARRAEFFADWAQFGLDEPAAARRLYAAARGLRDVARPGLPLRVLFCAFTILGADRGNVQILDPATGTLKIAAQQGFDADFLDYFAEVRDEASACGRAARTRIQTVIVDTDADRAFAPHREIAAASGFRAVHSTPLTDQSGRLIGVVSAHYPRPYSPSEGDLRLMRRYGVLAGETIAAAGLGDA